MEGPFGAEYLLILDAPADRFTATVPDTGPCQSILIDTLPERPGNKTYTITGRTSLQPGTELLFTFLPVEFEVSMDTKTKGFSGPVYGATGTVNVTRGTGSANTWSADLDLSTFPPDEYLINISTDRINPRTYETDIRESILFKEDYHFGLIVMKRITYLTCTLIVACMVAAMVGWSMAAGNFLVPVIAIPLGIIVVLACRAQVDTVIADERERRIRSKAALRTLEVVVIGGAIAAIILYSYVVSVPLAPIITGKLVINDDGTQSMTIAEYKPGSVPGPQNLVRSTTIKDLNAMNETEAMTYCTYVREGFSENEKRGLAGMTIGCSLAVLLVTFGAFYLYYNRKY